MIEARAAKLGQQLDGIEARRRGIRIRARMKGPDVVVVLRNDRKTIIETGNAEKIPAFPACEVIWKAVSSEMGSERNIWRA